MDKLKTDFINNISHEIRTPLNGIMGFSEMMVEEDITTEQKANYNEIIKKCGTRLLNTINSYMDSSLIVSGNMEAHSKPFSLDNLLVGIEQEFRERCNEKHIGLLLQKPSRKGEIQIITDQELLRKIISHLLDNAIKFTSEGTVSFGFRYKAGFIEFFVSDSGSGIESDQTEAIFEYFTQADTSLSRGYEGSGLGLSIARGLVKLLGGDIRVESLKSKGSSFYFTLPESVIGIMPAMELEVVKQPERQKAALILIAEDDEFNFKYLEITLKRAGYLVIRAENGQEAVEICHRNTDVSMILMDLKMPVMGGLEATREIRSFLPTLPIIAQTAYVSPADENEAYEAGCNEFLPKPVNRDRLLSLVVSMLAV
jgi:CheY-like chemotaxis protein